MGRLSKLRGAIGLGLSQLTHERQQAAFAILGVALAVLSATLLTGVGYGVIATGEEKFDASGRDLWVTGGAVQLQPGTIGGMDASIQDAHAVSDNISEYEGVRTAVPMLFQTVYAGNQNAVETTLAVGVPATTAGGGGTVQIVNGTGFNRSGHYADGTYDGPRIRQTILDPRLTDLHEVSVGDELYVGGTVVAARSNPHEVVGTSTTFTQFLGTPTLILPLAELQSMTGSAQSDSATMITIDVHDTANTSAIESRIQSEYPHLDVRTNQEQLQSVLAKQAIVIASGSALVILGIIAGLALSVNILSLLVFHQRKAIAAIRAIGVSQRTLVGMVMTQGLVIGVLGGALGLGLTPVLSWGLDSVAYSIVGFEGLVRTPQFVYIAGGIIAVGIGTISAVVAGWRVMQVDVLSSLRE